MEEGQRRETPNEGKPVCGFNPQLTGLWRRQAGSWSADAVGRSGR